MLKKAVIALTVSSLSTACIPFVNGVPSLDGVKSNNKNFSIKSTTNPTEIKKSFLPVTRITKLKKKDDEEKWRKYNFTATNEDLKRRFILNIINGSNNGERVGNLEVRLNGVSIITNHDEDLNETDDINKIKKKLCKESEHENEHKNDSKDSGKDDSDKKFKIKHNNEDKKDIQDCTTLVTNFFNRKTDSLSVNLLNIIEGLNTLEVRVKDERKNYSLDIGIDGFLSSYQLEGAIHSLIPRDNDMKQAEYKKGLLGIKFLEGMKVRLITDSNNNQKLVDLNGTSLEGLNRLLKLLGIKHINRSINLPEDFLEQSEIKIETSRGIDAPNMNLFYRLQVDENTDIWELTDKLRSLPYIEESYPYFVEQKAYDLPTDPQVYGVIRKSDIHLFPGDSLPYTQNYRFYRNNNSSSVITHLAKDPIDKSDWLAFMHVMPNNMDSGAWIRTQGSPNIKSTTIAHGFQHSNLGTGQKTHEDLVDIIAINNTKNVPSIDTDIEHQTDTIGIIGAKANNSLGIAGISHNGKTISIQAYRDGVQSLCSGTGDPNCEPTIDSLVLTIESLYSGSNSKTILIAAPGRPYTIEMANPEIKAAINLMVEYGTTIILPADNGFNKDVRKMESKDAKGNTIFVDTPDSGSIVVGGLSLDGSKRHENNYNYGVSKAGGTNNLGTVGGHGIDVGGPAEEIWTTSAKSSNPNKIDDYDRFGGTSGASPAITGIINLMFALKPTLTPYEVRKILRDTRQDDLLKVTPDDDPNNLCPTPPISGCATHPTAGMVNAWEALNKVSPFTTKAGTPSSSYGFKINSTTLDSTNVIGHNTNLSVNYQTYPNKIYAAPIVGSAKDIIIKVGGQDASIVGYAPNTIGFTVPTTLTPGSKDVTLTTPTGTITFDNALNVVSNTMSKHFPESVTVNGVTTTLDYGLKLEFNECSGNLVKDLSGNNNNAEFVKRSNTDEFPSWLIDQSFGCGVNFSNSNYGALRVKGNDSYQLGSKSTMIVILKNDSFANDVSPSVPLQDYHGILTKYSNIGYEIGQFGNNAFYGIWDLLYGYRYFEVHSFDLFNGVGTPPIKVLSASIDLENKNFLMMGDDKKFPYYETVAGSNINGLSTIQDSSSDDLFIGNFVEYNTIWDYAKGFNGTIYGVALVKQALTEEQIKEVVKSIKVQ